VIEVDVYEGALRGLIVAEVEFDDPWGAESFAVPYWFAQELTGQAAYSNQRLALDGLPLPGSP
jgi:adenylate cyclase